MFYNFKIRSISASKVLAAILCGVFVPSIAGTQTYFHGDPTTLRPPSGIAPKGFMHTDYLYKNPALFPGGLNPDFGSGLIPGISTNIDTSPPFRPADIQIAYNIPSTAGGDAIAIVDAYDEPTALTDFNTFSSDFRLPTESSSTVTASTNKVFQVVYASGSKPSSGVANGWSGEEALDIEWAHVMAPSAKIYLVEANSSSDSDLYAAVAVAAALPNVKEVSDSWGGGEYSTETSDDSKWVQSGVSFFFSAGDDAVQEYPSESVNAVSVGGTSITLTSTGYGSESGWSDSGGGPSAFESRPAFQNPVSTVVGSVRGDPDCSAVADPNTGVYVYEAGAWSQVGGTSLACPVVAGITNSREFELNNFSTSSQTEEQRIYNQLMGFYYRDITTGQTPNETCEIGWDFVTGVGSPNGLLAPWQGIHGNVPGNGQGLGSGAQNLERWQIGAGGAFEGGSAVDARNIVYFGSTGGTLCAADGATGTLFWTYATGGLIEAAPAIGPDGSVFIASGDNVFCIKNGKRVWLFNAGATVQCSPAIGSNETVYIGAGGANAGEFYALNGASGNVIWSQSTGGAVESSPAIGADGTVYFGSSSGFVYALDGATGAVTWKHSIASPITASPAIGGNGVVYVGASNDSVYALSPSSGAQLWTYKTGGAISSSVAVATNGDVYVGSDDDNVYALNGTSGALLWKFATGGEVTGGIALGSDGTVYAGSSDKNLYSLNGSTGALNWKFATGAVINATPAIGADGTVYIGNSGEGVHGVGFDMFSALNPQVGTLTGGSSTTGTLTLTAPAIAAPIMVKLSSNNSAVTVPGTVELPAVQRTITFAIKSTSVTSQQIATITASLNGGSIQTKVTVNP